MIPLQTVRKAADDDLPASMEVGGPSVYFKTYGCQMNVADSDRMARLMRLRGYRLVEAEADADVVVLNTCSVREKPEHKVLSYVGTLTPQKKSRGTTIAVVGCVAQQRGDELIQANRNIDIVLGPDRLDDLPDAVEAVRGVANNHVNTDWMMDMGRAYNLPVVEGASQTGPVAYLNIMKGCDHFCTFCIVPYTRGRERSRPMAEVEAEVRSLVASGVREVTLLGQNIDSYGKKTDESLHELIDLLAEIDGLARIRFLTSHPRDMKPELMDRFGTIEKLMPYLHLPVQSGSNHILKRMNRKYTREKYFECIDYVRSKQPAMNISSDFIIGFPGETDEDFEQTMDLVRQVDFGQSFSFIYSKRPGTRAEKFEDPTPEPVKKERLQALQALLTEQVQASNAAFVGQTVQVLVEGPSKSDPRKSSGRTRDNRLIHFDSDGLAPGDLAEMTVHHASANYLMGRPLGSATEAAPPISQRNPQVTPA